GAHDDGGPGGSLRPPRRERPHRGPAVPDQSRDLLVHGHRAAGAADAARRRLPGLAGHRRRQGPGAQAVREPRHRRAAALPAAARRLRRATPPARRALPGPQRPGDPPAARGAPGPYRRGSHRNIFAAMTTATRTHASVGASSASEPVSAAPPSQAATISSVAAPPGRSRLSRAMLSVPVLPTQLATAMTPMLRGRAVTWACSRELVTSAVADPRARSRTNAARVAATRSTASTGPLPLAAAKTPRIRVICTSAMAPTGRTSPVRMVASLAAVDRSCLRKRPWRRAASVVTVVA